MKKTILLFLAFMLFCTVFVSCGDADLPGYVTGTLEYTGSDDGHSVRILYPVFDGTDKAAAITEELKARAISYMEEYLLYRNTAGESFGYTVDQVNAAYQSDLLVSVLSVGSYYADGAPHPETVVYTANVNPTSGAVYEFDDIVTDFDAIAALFSDGGFTYLGGANSIFEESRETLSPADLIAGYSSLYGIYPPVYFTLHDGDVCFALSVELIDTFGGHAEFCIPAKAVRDALSGEICQILFN